MKKLMLALLLAFVAFPVFATEKESTYGRIMRTKTIRCGYLVYEPYVSKDTVSGEMSGVIVDYMNDLAEKQGLAIDWAGEANIDQVVPALEANRFDMFCIPATPDQNWEKVLGFSGDLGALPYFVYVPQDSVLTEEQLKKAKFALVDGYALTDITTDAFPDAQFYSLPQTVSTAEMYDQLRYGKADALVNEHVSAESYMKNNPGVIRRFSDKPVIAMRMFLVTRKGDEEMRRFAQEVFGTDNPGHLALMQEFLAKYNVPAGALLLGDDCAAPGTTEKGWKVCR